MITICGYSQTDVKLVITLNNIESDTLLLAKSHEDLRYHGVKIPVENNKRLEYDFSPEHIEEYVLVYKSEHDNGMYRPISFFPSSPRIEFELYPSNQYDNNKITGDELGIRKSIYQTSFGNKFMKTGNEIYGSFFSSEENSAERKRAKIRLDSLNNAALEYHHEYFKDDNSILALNEYVEILKNAEQMMIEPKVLQRFHQEIIKKEFNHPLAEKANNLFTALSSLKVGEKYVNIQLDAADQSQIELSDKIISGQYTLLDLWAPWCGPCIRKSKKLKNYYSSFNNKLNIVGIVGGVTSIDEALKAIDKYEYPWSTYLEVSDKNQIWEKYNISRSGGAQFLINDKGVIISINPTINELQSLVNE